MTIPHSHENCITACQHCYETCLATVQGHCLDKGGRHVDAHHVRLMHDCATICHTSVTLMLSHSSFHPQMCALCAEVCTSCAQDCASFAEEADGMMQQCVDACLACANACRAMTQAHRAR